MHPILAAFPRRSLTLHASRSRIGAWLLALAFVLFGVGIIALLAIEVGPGIRDDFKVRDGAVPTALARLESGRCSAKLGLFQSCDITVSVRGKDGVVRREVSYLFVEPHMGNRTTEALLNPAHPTLPTTRLGVDMLINRVVVAAVFVAFALALFWAGFAAVRSDLRLRRRVAAISGRALEPEAVRLRAFAQGPAWMIEDARGATATWPVGRRTKPFMLDPATGLILALRAPGGEAFPLDDRLRSVDLAPPERAALLALPAG
ncbi:hypothetical protein ACQW02_26845 [Humitalea sp. 24SJ18S-53]|uniref:hypothetical protein n=1 Tax=Humitalea sp. 24SJ18S-53 TaxID=3422307 RepID=UPI003D66781B